MAHHIALTSARGIVSVRLTGVPISVPRPSSSKLLHARHVVSATLAKDAPPKKAPRKENVAGEMYVDHTCIDCDTCRWMAPSVFTRVGGMSAVYHQPNSDEERLQALQALVSCPVNSIHSAALPSEMQETQNSFPIHITGDMPAVYHCGYHSAKSFAAASYYLQTPGCNVLIDSPRFSEDLARRIEAMGGVDFIFLTHKDDVADHDKWAKRFKCPRVLHKKEVGWRDTGNVEIQLEGEGPWYLPIKEGEGVGLPPQEESGRKLKIVFTPGHTDGHCCLYLPPSEGSPGVMFSGDHLGMAMHGEGGIAIDEAHNWYSVDLQRESVRKLLDFPFTWLLPGHGRRAKFDSEDERIHALKQV